MNTPGPRMEIDRIRFAQLVAITLGILGVGLLFFTLLKSAVEMLLLIFAGILFAIFIRGVNRFLFGRLLPLPEKIGILVTVLLVILSCFVFFILLAPQLMEQGERLVRQLPEAFDQLHSKIGSSEWFREMIRSWGGSEPVSAMKNMTGKALGFFATTFGAITSVFIILFVGIYLAFTPHYYIKGLLRLVPERGSERASQVFAALGHTLGRWLIGRFLGMMIVGILTFLGLLVLQIPLALSLATLAGLLTFIPNIGPIISAIPPILLGFMQSPVTSVYVILLYSAIQAVESYLITPLIQQREVSLPPVLTLSAQVVLGSILGLLGLILATPLTAAALVLVRMLYIENVLGDK